MGKTLVKFHKPGAYGYANVAEGTFRTKVEGEEKLLDAETARQLSDLGCCEILERNIEEEPEAEEEEKPKVLKAIKKPATERKRGRHSAKETKE